MGRTDADCSVGLAEGGEVIRYLARGNIRRTCIRFHALSRRVVAKVEWRMGEFHHCHGRKT